MSFQEFIANLTKEDLEQINIEFQKKQNKIPTYSFSKIKFLDLEKLVDIEEEFDDSIFNNWFSFNFQFADEDIIFLQLIIDDNIHLIKSYKEEDLKVKVLIPILNKVRFLNFKNKIRDFYEEHIIYKTDKFIFSGTPDFLVSNSLTRAKKPYFFIQEFKKSKEYSDPEPQLLAELIAAVELNNWQNIKGAYIIGQYWNFVILKKLNKNKYQYFVSRSFDSMRIEDLKAIYKNLLFVKNEIIQMVRKDF